tara:strand:+ start:96 stop:542 length:447 start_codon:yes stop_codon:yes gene_type:complete
MNTQKEVFNKLFKEEKTKLSATELRKIELGVADNISKALSDAKSTLKEIKDSNSNLKAADSKLVSDIKAAIKQADGVADKDIKLKSAALKKTMKFAGILEKAEKAAKDLGVSPSAIAGYTELDKLHLDIDDEASETFMWSDLEPLVRF